MAEHNTELTIVEPKGLWRKSFQINGKDVAKAMTPLLVGNWAGGFVELVKTFLSATPTMSLGEQAGSHLLALLPMTFNQAVHEHEDRLDGTRVSGATHEALERLRTAVFAGHVLSGQTFAHDTVWTPLHTALADALADVLRGFAHDVEWGEEVAGLVRANAGLYFVQASLQLQAHLPAYGAFRKVLAERFPMDERVKTMEQDAEYRGRLACAMDEQIFGGLATYRQLYIELKADLATRLEQLYDVAPVALDDCMEDWVRKADGSCLVRLIVGEPGSGKSCFMRRFAAWAVVHARELHGYQVRLVRVRDLKWSTVPNKEELAKELKQHLRLKHGASFFTADDLTIPPTLLLIDGLDELEMLQSQGVEAALKFVRRVAKLAHNLYQKGLPPRLLVCITSRTLLYQALKDKRGELGTVLNTIQLLRIQPMGESELHAWWDRMLALQPEMDRSVVQTIESKESFREISNYPLLNYLLAMVLREKGANLEAIGSRAQLYERLIGSIYRAEHNDKESLPLNMLFRHEDAYFEFLERLAWRAWVGGQETKADWRSFLNDLAGLDLDKDRRLETLFSDECAENIRDWHAYECLIDPTSSACVKPNRLIAKLPLAMFYLHESGEPGARLVEFTHKTFAEYLVARRLLRQAREWGEEPSKNDATLLLRSWFLLTGPARLNNAMLGFLFEIAEARPRSGDHPFASCTVWIKRQQAVECLLAASQSEGLRVLENGEQATIPLSSQTLLAQIANAEEALLALAQTCLRGAGSAYHFLRVPWNDKSHLRILLQRLLIPGREGVARYCMRRVCWSGSFLYGTDLGGADLGGADLSEANLGGADLEGANLIGTDLRRANLVGAKLVGAQFGRAALESGADLGGTTLVAANLVGAILAEANLARASLIGARLVGAYLVEANLSGANLQVAKLCGADLRRADLQGADLRGADLRGADLSEAKLEGGKLGGASLRGADLSGAELSGVCLYGVDLRGASLRGADLRGVDSTRVHSSRAEHSGVDLRGAACIGADLDGVDLHGADLSGATLSGANLVSAQNLVPSQIKAARWDKENPPVLPLYLKI
ncbi:putative Pentapeptide repeat protein [Megalodesulfovibrio gigas DSM 1382 = ATCC 19364]|uniref:Putative Pentapeptide repeat protein n=1 Tax=Megalodesulfovibrio gigas (strain ATCC 19364 / DSM 1382 / NCIMB 9332 / VKM B-1759) TaxID=1121448 RepID=T2GC98_MEGG1|nr:putative Pentapeptide repeat protein [Megalodesulfovibrio gigas DSM 1382 = ATCC 19364]